MMAISPDQAADSLKEIARTEARSGQARLYANASPGFILWGVIWMIGYGASDFLGRAAGWGGVNWLWSGLTVIGFIGSFVIGRAQHRCEARDPAIGWRWAGTFLALWLFAIATFLVLRPTNPAAAGAFIPLIVAVVYAVFGIWQGARFLYAGIVVAAATLGGFLFLREHFLLWMAFVGGGSLIVVGLWLRKI
jgi:hypothetical protein